jgi:hypothetical protein
MDNIKTAGKIPELNIKNFMLYELLIKSWLKRFHSSDKALTENEPKFNLEDYADTLDEEGEDTEETAVRRSTHREDYRMWVKRNDIAYSSIVESCQNNPTAMLLILELGTTSAKELWEQIVKKFNLQYLSIKQKELANFNALSIEPTEKLSEFINKLKQGKLNLMNLGHTLNDDVELLGRLKSGISKDKRFTHIISSLTFNDYTWKEAVEKIDLIDNLNDNLQIDLEEAKAKPSAETAQYTGNHKNNLTNLKTTIKMRINLIEIIIIIIIIMEIQKV